MIRSLFLHQRMTSFSLLVCNWLCTWGVLKEICGFFCCLNCIMKHIKLFVLIPHVSAAYVSAIIFSMSHYNNHWSLTNHKVAYWCIIQIFKCGICVHADGCISMSYLNVCVISQSLTGLVWPCAARTVCSIKFCCNVYDGEQHLVFSADGNVYSEMSHVLLVHYWLCVVVILKQT